MNCLATRSTESHRLRFLLNYRRDTGHIESCDISVGNLALFQSGVWQLFTPAFGGFPIGNLAGLGLEAYFDRTGISQASVLRELGIGKNMASVHPCIGKFIKRKNSQYIQVMNNFVNRNADNVHELKRENKALKDRDIDLFILSAKLDEMEKENKNLRKEIERLNSVIAYRNLN